MPREPSTWTASGGGQSLSSKVCRGRVVRGAGSTEWGRQHPSGVSPLLSPQAHLDLVEAGPGVPAERRRGFTSQEADQTSEGKARGLCLRQLASPGREVPNAAGGLRAMAQTQSQAIQPKALPGDPAALSPWGISDRVLQTLRG